MIAALLLAAVTPEATDLARQLSASGMLATIAPMVMAKEAEEIVASHPELSDDETARFRASAKATASRLKDRVMAAEADAYAKALTVEDLRALVRFSNSNAAKRQRAAMPQVMVGTMAALGNVDFKGEAKADFCKASGKLCPADK